MCPFWRRKESHATGGGPAPATPAELDEVQRQVLCRLAAGELLSAASTTRDGVSSYAFDGSDLHITQPQMDALVTAGFVELQCSRPGGDRAAFRFAITAAGEAAAGDRDSEESPGTSGD